SVGLAPSFDGIYTGTHWELTASNPGFVLKCKGTIVNPQHQYLDGRTQEGSVGLAPSFDGIYTGTHWELIPVLTPEEQRLVDLVNAARQQAGCPPLQVDPRLMAVAEAHSRYMADHNALVHDEQPGNVTPDQRIRPLGFGTTGENIYSGWGTVNGVYQGSPEAAMDSWMNHDENADPPWGHKYNIIGCDPNDTNNTWCSVKGLCPPPTASYRWIGVGIVQAADANGTVYFTQDFAG
ncbi:CAP domain-containing protein, partial [Streptomyces sp. NPDC001450]